ncbi:Uncharacterised protein [Vibrio cholerae]|nr:Uncharacterised protein [Vibrio cholerae]
MRVNAQPSLILAKDGLSSLIKSSGATVIEART